MRIKYRVGVMPGPWPAAATGRELLWRFIDLCESSGIDSVWFSERLSSPGPVLEPMTTMAAVAARTQRLKFGPSVLVAPFRSPVLLARELAMIDYLSNGRMLPAVGVGAEQDREFRAAGLAAKEDRRDDPHPAQALERGRGYVRRRVLPAGPDHGAAQAAPAAVSAVDRRQLGGRHASRRRAGRR